MQIVADRNLSSQSPAVRQTVTGSVRGTCDNGVCRFLGLPYAAPPVGAYRFKEPQRVRAWPGLRDATKPGDIAPQKIRDFPQLDIVALVGKGAPDGEDYLTLNVWTPVAAKQLPVMVASAWLTDFQIFSSASSRALRAAMAGPAASPSTQSPWTAQFPAQSSPASRGTHRKLAWAIANRDPEEAEKRMAQHFDEAIGALLR